MRLFIISLFVMLLTACYAAIEEPELSPSLGQVDLARQLSGDWERICIFTPYTTGVRGEAISGINRYAIHATDIPHSDSFVVLGAVFADESYTLYRVSMDNVAFVNNQPECFSRDAAVLRTR